jgi:D-arginine dehydrogenase
VSVFRRISVIQPKIVIIGSGMAGASLGWALAGHADVTIVEAEATPGYHTTGRSAAFYAETYGGEQVQPLTTASKSFLFAPPEEFSRVPLVHPRGALHVATQGQLDKVADMARTASGLSPGIEVLGRDAIAALAPMLKEAWCAGAVFDRDCKDIDVAVLHGAYLAGARRAGARLITGAAVRALTRRPGDWLVDWGEGSLSADMVVNAAGAWADDIARLAEAEPIGLSPRRRTIVTFAPAGPPVDPALPLVLDIDESFYFKPQGGEVWASPADETPSPPCDSQPEELDKALTVARIEAATHWQVLRLRSSWAGLRSFAPDRAPVFGEDAQRPGFFWCAGQGGFGIQTAPAASQLCAAMVLDRAVPDTLAAVGITATRYSPLRFKRPA